MNETDKKIYQYAQAIKDYCNDRECDGCPFRRNSDKLCVMEFDVPYEWDFEKTEVFKAAQTFKVGDEIRLRGSDPKMDDCDVGLVTYIDGKYMYVMRRDGSGADEKNFDDWEKTGMHYREIETLLYKMRLSSISPFIYVDTDSIKTEGPYRGGFTHTDSVKEDPDGPR